ncbi:hypothetical protein MCAP1_001305 [Malassezia caprae]|uniref:Uncharacterized protein n=1 Tax=Malassezia caprae TaxID=1381934 RepID=A0AAF0E664_9BASI|nr:hypothetical protein MCAP1_001305 [Malassezia caprae]
MPDKQLPALPAHPEQRVFERARQQTGPVSDLSERTVSQSRTSDAPTLSVALPSPYLLLASSQTSSELGVEHALPPESHTQIPSVSANVSHTEVPVREQATLDASLPVEPPGLSQETACVEPPNMDITPPIPEDWAAGLVQPCLMIEYCDRCRWQHRATWIQTELLITFSAKQTEQPSAASGGGFLASTMLVPRVAPETAGRFRMPRD